MGLLEIDNSVEMGMGESKLLCGKSTAVGKVNVYLLGCGYFVLMVVVYRMKGGEGEKRKTERPSRDRLEVKAKGPDR